MNPTEHNYQLLQERGEKLARVAASVSAMLVLEAASPALPHWDKMQLMQIWQETKEYLPPEMRDRLDFLR